MSSWKPQPPEEGIDAFLGEPSRHLNDWYWLWTQDREFPIQSHRGGLLGRAIVGFKRLMRPLTKTPLSDLLDRQRMFNIIMLEHLRLVEEEAHTFHNQVSSALKKLEDYRLEGLSDVVGHTDALFALLDQKLDRCERRTRDLRQILEQDPATGESPASGDDPRGSD